MAAKSWAWAAFAFGLACIPALPGAQPPQRREGRSSGAGRPEPTGFLDTPFIPGTKWHVHDDNRPRPAAIDPGTASTPDKPGVPPSDALILFDGKDLSHWANAKSGGAAPWKVVDGAIEIVPYSGDIRSIDPFGDCQIHIEWVSPAEIKGESQGRGNTGVYIMGKYEVQILDSYRNKTYADGQAGAIYGQYPPLVNAARKPGEWQTHDIVFEAPKFDGDRLVKPAYLTVLYNGILVQNRRPLQGPTVNKAVAHYTAHADKLPLVLQDHHNPVRLRNIWVRPLDFGEPDLTIPDLKKSEAPAPAAKP